MDERDGPRERETNTALDRPLRPAWHYLFPREELLHTHETTRYEYHLSRLYDVFLPIALLRTCFPMNVGTDDTVCQNR